MSKFHLIEPLAQHVKPMSVNIRSGSLLSVFGQMLEGPVMVQRLCPEACTCGIRLIHREELSHDEGFFSIYPVDQIVSGKAALVCIESSFDDKLQDMVKPVSHTLERIKFLPDCKLLGWYDRIESFDMGNSLIVSTVQQPIFSTRFKPLAEVLDVKLSS